VPQPTTLPRAPTCTRRHHLPAHVVGTELNPFCYPDVAQMLRPPAGCNDPGLCCVQL
jgi:hypothetical protein